MVDRDIEIEFNGINIKAKFDLTIQDKEPFGRPYTYLSSHCMLTALIFNQLLEEAYTSKILPQSKFTIPQFTYAALHHDDGKTKNNWQEWFKSASMKQKYNWYLYEDHVDPKSFDKSLHVPELKKLESLEISINEQADNFLELIHWIIRNHHPHKAKDAISLRKERMILIISDHLAAKIENPGNQSSLDLNISEDLIQSHNYLYGHYFSYYHPEILQLGNNMDVTVKISQNEIGSDEGVGVF